MINDKDYLNVKATLNSMSFVNEIAKRCVKLCRGPKFLLEMKRHYEIEVDKKEVLKLKSKKNFRN